MPARVVAVLLAFLALVASELDRHPDQPAPFELPGGPGKYWMDGDVLTFTSTDGDTQQVRDLQWGLSGPKLSPDRSTLALLDGSHGPTDEFGTHALQVVVFDTRTGQQLYRTPEEEVQTEGDLEHLFGEVRPLLIEVTNAQVVLEGITIDIDTGEVTVQDPESIDAYLFAGAEWH